MDAFQISWKHKKVPFFFFTSRLYLERGLKRLDTFGISYIGMANPIGESTITTIPKAETLLLSRMLDLLLDRNKERHSLIETPCLSALDEPTPDSSPVII